MMFWLLNLVLPAAFKPFAKLIGYALIAVAIALALIWVRNWHDNKVQAVFEAGRLKERAVWEELVVAAERARAEKRREAELAVAIKEKQYLEELEALEAENRGLNDELERALADAGPSLSQCVVPRGVLAPLRKKRTR